jgi:arylsulfatase A-like enzyme
MKKQIGLPIRIGFAFCGLVAGGLPLVVAAAPAPNILLIMADQWRAQAFGYAGDPNVKTPHLDRLERASVNFTQAVSGMPVCTPARASLQTGQRPLTHGLFLNDVPLNPKAVTLAKVLATAGYDTGCIGKWHIDGQGRSAFIPRERRQGFDYWKVLECTHAYNRSPYFADGAEKLQWEGYDAIAQTRDAQRYLEDPARSRKPFYLFLSWGPPHNPYETAPAKYQAMYSPEKIQLRGNVPAERQAVARKELAGYYAHCTALDDCVGDLLATLKKTGQLERTIVVFSSDHGDMLWSQGEQRKQRPFEEAARVPLLFHLPPSLGIGPRRVAGTINIEDWMPTLLGLAGKKIPASVEGLDFSGYLRGGADPSGGATLLTCVSPFGEWQRDRGGREYRALRTARYTYVRDLNGPWLLFDHDTDPEEHTNLAGRPEQAALLARLDAQLRARLAATKDEFRPGADYIARWGYTVDAKGTVSYKN